MNIESFLDRWRSYGPAKQLAILLAVLTKRTDTGELRIPMDEIDSISAGETVVYMENAKSKEIILRFSPEFTTLYTIEESVHERKQAWPSQLPAQATSVPSSDSQARPIPKTDEQLADLEEQVQRQQQIRNAAREARSVPMYQAPQPKAKGRTANPRPPLPTADEVQ
jgi:hypothetical protein